MSNELFPMENPLTGSSEKARLKLRDGFYFGKIERIVKKNVETEVNGKKEEKTVLFFIINFSEDADALEQSRAQNADCSLTRRTGSSINTEKGSLYKWVKEVMGPGQVSESDFASSASAWEVTTRMVGRRIECAIEMTKDGKYCNIISAKPVREVAAVKSQPLQESAGF